MIFVTLALDVALLVLLFLASIEDLRTRLIPPKYQIAFLIVAVARVVTHIIVGDFSSMRSCLIAGVGVFALYIITFAIFRKGVGGADTKITSTLALYLGVWQTFELMIAHTVFGILYVAANAVKKRKMVTSLPLMPIITAAYILTRATFYTLFI